MAASTASGITTLEGMAGKTFCVGNATTYVEWLRARRSISAADPTTTPPAREVTAQQTDNDCPQLWAPVARFDGFLAQARRSKTRSSRVSR